jgi:hypothetical protein
MKRAWLIIAAYKVLVNVMMILGVIGQNIKEVDKLLV